MRKRSPKKPKGSKRIQSQISLTLPLFSLRSRKRQFQLRHAKAMPASMTRRNKKEHEGTKKRKKEEEGSREKKKEEDGRTRMSKEEEGRQKPSAILLPAFCQRRKRAKREEEGGK